MSEHERTFVDTNVWLYAFISSQDKEKSHTAREFIQTKQADLVISVQVVSEVCANLIKKADYAESEIRAVIDSFYANYPVVDLGRFLFLRASELRERYSFSFWDSTIVAAALHEQVPVLLSEDLQDGLLVDDCTTIMNPFDAAH